MRKYVTGPDGGWGWVVCLGTFIVAFIVEGTTAAFGVLIIPIQEEFKASKSSTTWVASLSFGVCYLIGPIVSMFLERFSLRQVTITGAVIGFIAFTVSAFSPNIIVLIIAYGILGGISMGVTFMTAIVAVGRYFNNRRAMATGLAMSGAGFGMFAYPFFTEIILQVLDWRGTVLLVAAIYLNCAVSGAMFRPLAILEPEEENTDTTVSLETREKLILSQKRKLLSEKNYHSLQHINSHVLQYEELAAKANSMDCVKITDKFLPSGLSKNDIYSSGFMQISCEQIQSESKLSSIEPENENSRCVNMARYGDNFHVLKQPSFIVVLLTMVFWSVQYICTLYIPDFASSKGIPGTESALLVSFIGVTNTLGRIFTGFIIDFLHIRSITLYFTAFVVVTIGTFLLPFCISFWQIAVYSIISGFCVGTFTGMRTIVIVDFVGIDHLSHAFGWVSFFQGISCIPVPPLAGFIYDKSGSYFYTFLLVATYYLCGCVTSLSLRLSNRCCKTEETLTEEEQPFER
ncbi:monocarboxylate transporter 14-like isoform X1 [Mytilus californianus]|uniref:monocarboxylate transporter 14-like isoform X1 n=1 Tax=Mytilus californianus TaxID=6549 RepID=UPI0022473B1D|nr:monocarboxylate transporter 14-like isoform X1 [Mytilus californianus]